MTKDIREKLKGIRMLVSDFDGVMTDGFVFVDQDGVEMVRCSRRDSMGTGLLQKAGIPVIVISKEINPVVAARCRKLNIPCYQGVKTGEGKLQILKEILEKEKIDPKEIVYVGDDINDIPPLNYAGVAITVSDGHPLVKEISDYVTSAKGGEHAIREICELILEAKGIPPCC